MKHIRPYTASRTLMIAAACALTLLAANVSADAAGKHALLIGISDYQDVNPDGPFPTIHCDLDLAYIREALRDRFGFTAADIATVSDQAATKIKILTALDQIAAETRPGDIIYIHYSGHGSLVNDADAPGGLDSTLVPINYTITPQSEIDGHEIDEASTNEISGRTLRTKIAAIEAKQPTQLVLSFDECHSGRIYRGASMKRGMSFEELSDWLASHGGRPLTITPNASAEASSAATRSEASGLAGQFPELDSPDARYILFAACDTDESDTDAESDGKPVGPLSLALFNAFENASSETTYRQVFNQVPTSRPIWPGSTRRWKATRTRSCSAATLPSRPAR